MSLASFGSRSGAFFFEFINVIFKKERKEKINYHPFLMSLDQNHVKQKG